jgi:hypothetical protein
LTPFFTKCKHIYPDIYQVTYFSGIKVSTTFFLCDPVDFGTAKLLVKILTPFAGASSEKARSAGHIQYAAYNESGMFISTLAKRDGDDFAC